MTQGELLELAKSQLENVPINFMDDIEVSIHKSDDDKQRIVIDITHDSYDN